MMLTNQVLVSDQPDIACVKSRILVNILSHLQS